MATTTRATLSIDRGSSPETKRCHRSRESSFSYKYGHRHHSYDPEKAPYPLSYDKEVIGLDLLDHAFMQKVNKRLSFVNWQDVPPRSVLDLGCGSGAWIVEAAKQWPDCHFVGFDLVNIQPPASYMDHLVAKKVQWVHGNFLTTKLPFEDDEFDLVRVAGIARGVPENKWSVLYSEIHRVLCPGGIMESIEEDIIFPTLPRWFTSPLRSRSRRAASIHLPDGSQRSMPSQPSQKDGLQHDHALLESLFYSVFESRFINCRPTAILPAFATSVFRYVRAGPILNMKMPPLAPAVPSSAPKGSSLSSDFPSLSYTETSSCTSLPTLSSGNSSAINLDFSSVTDREEDTYSRVTTSSLSSVDSGSSSNHSSANKTPPHPFNTGYTSIEETSSVSFGMESTFSSYPNSTISMQHLSALAPETMATQLYRTYEGVLACQEAMWEQLKDRVRNRPEELKALGWDDEELEEMQGRKKFETLVQRYRDDMHYRVALWYSLTRLGWELPPQGPLTRAEIIEEDRLRQAMLDARKFALEEDMRAPCRSIRMVIGVKDSG